MRKEQFGPYRIIEQDETGCLLYKDFHVQGVIGQEKGRDGFKDGSLFLIFCAFAHGNKISDVSLSLNLEHSIDG